MARRTSEIAKLESDNGSRTQILPEAAQPRGGETWAERVRGELRERTKEKAGSVDPAVIEPVTVGSLWVSERSFRVFGFLRRVSSRNSGALNC